MIIKLDLEKAYDRFEWNFIRDTLFLVGLAPCLINLIEYCFNSVSMSINWNGDNSESFQSSRGLR